MKYYNFLFPCLLGFALTGLTSCGNNEKTPASLADSTPDSVTFKERIDWPKNKAEIDNTEVDKNIKDYVGAYTYRVNPDEVPVAVVKREELPDDADKELAKKGNQHKESDQGSKSEPPGKLEKINISIEPPEDELPEITLNESALLGDLRLNRPPIFGLTCLQTELPVKCSRDNLKAYIQNNLEYPRMAKFNDHDGMEHVTFTITKNGKMENVAVQEKDSPCSGCAEAAKAVVAAMPEKWVPALRNGKPVSVTVTLPIEFETEQYGDKLFE
jgi:TonB family protein